MYPQQCTCVWAGHKCCSAPSRRPLPAQRRLASPGKAQFLANDFRAVHRAPLGGGVLAAAASSRTSAKFDRAGFPLTPEQERAASAPQHETAAIIAGAGTGKTTVLVARALWLLEQGVDPSTMVITAYNRKAAHELRVRLTESLGTAGAVKDIDRLCCTFHGFCYRIIKRFWANLNPLLECSLNQMPQPMLEDEDHLAVIKDAMRMCDLEETRRRSAIWLQLPAAASWESICKAADESNPALFDRVKQETDKACSDRLQRHKMPIDGTVKARLYAHGHQQDLQWRLFRALQAKHAGHEAGKESFKIVGQDLEVEEKAAQQMAKWLRKVKGKGLMPVFFWGRHREVFLQYQRLLLEMHLIDFDDMLIYAIKLLQDVPAVREQMQAETQYLLMDEFQDINPLQREVLDLLMEDGTRLTAVGDDAQSIYGFRGSQAGAMARLIQDRRLTSDQTYGLTLNHRSTPQILEAAAVVLDDPCAGTPPSLLQAVKPPGKKVELVSVEDDKAQAEWTVAEVARLSAQGHFLKDMAVLQRNIKGCTEHLEDAFLARGIPYTISGGPALSDAAAVKDALAYCRLASNLFDDLAMRRIINKPARRIGDSKLGEAVQRQQLFEKETGKRCSLFQAAQTMDDKAVRAFVSLILDVQSFIITHTPAEVLDYALEQSGYAAYLQKAMENQPRKVLSKEKQSGKAHIACSDNTDPYKEYAAAMPEPQGSHSQGLHFDRPVLSHPEIRRLYQSACAHSAAAQSPPSKGGDEAKEPADDESQGSNNLSAVEAMRQRADSLTKGLQGADFAAAQAGQGYGPQAMSQWLEALHEGALVDDEGIKDCVTFSSIHAAKGLEFGFVFIPRCNEGYLPSEVYGPRKWGEPTAQLPSHAASKFPSQEAAAQVQAGEGEEIRLAYVGVTRAKTCLTLLSSRHLPDNKRFIKDCRPALFICKLRARPDICEVIDLQYPFRSNTGAPEGEQKPPT